ncbi:hypothetical protein DL765_005920 [Monosporascus sp. GIB2]|nr:hypothetical protein DL765_005920 [Monosporascus sp. GIB2]
MAVAKAKQPYFGLRASSWSSGSPQVELLVQDALPGELDNRHPTRVACSSDMVLVTSKFTSPQKTVSKQILIRFVSQVVRSSRKIISMSMISTNLRGQALSIVASIYTIGCFLGAAAAFAIRERDTGASKRYHQDRHNCHRRDSANELLQRPPHDRQPYHHGHLQGNQHGHCSDAADGDVQGQQPRFLVAFETSINIVGYCPSSWINYMRDINDPVTHGREKEATEILADLEDKPIDDPEIIAGRQEVVFSVEYERQNATRRGDLLRGRTKAAVSLPIQYVFYPETANCTLEVLDAYYCGDPPLLVPVRQRAQLALAHDHDAGEAAQDLRRRFVFAHPGV